jgi:BASS family bile acid:Na+ symporter
VKELLIASIAVMAFVAQPLLSFSIGLETGGPQIRTLFARPGLNLRFFLATFVVMPAIAIGLGASRILPVALWGGLALMSIAPPAPPATRRLKRLGNFNVGLAWQAEAFIVSVVTVPATVALVVASGLITRELDLAWNRVLLRSILFFAGPLVLGLLVRRYLPRAADAMQKPIGMAALIAFGILAVLALIAAIPILWHFGVGPAAIVIAFVAVAIAVGHVMGGPGRDTRVTLAAMLAARFPVPALLLAQANGALKTVLPVVLVYVLAGTVLVPLYDRLTKPRA